MPSCSACLNSEHVALLAEGVDRNSLQSIHHINNISSPSSRRAWIEIWMSSYIPYRLLYVALLAEGVDRNISSR